MEKKQTDLEIVKQVNDKWGKTHYIDKLPIPKDGLVDLEQLERNQSVVYGDGKSYYFRLTKRPVK